MSQHIEVTRRNGEDVAEGNVSAMFVRMMATGSWLSLLASFTALKFFEQAIEMGIEPRPAITMAAKSAAAMVTGIETGAKTPSEMLPHYPTLRSRYENIVLVISALLCRKSTMVARKRIEGGTVLFLDVIGTVRREAAKRKVTFGNTGMAEPWSVTAEHARKLLVRIAKGAVEVRIGTTVENASPRELSDALELMITLASAGFAVDAGEEKGGES